MAVFGPLEFLVIYDCTERWNALVAQGAKWEGLTPPMKFYGIQQDVKDYHIFRVYEDPENECLVLEHEQLPVHRPETVKAIMLRDIDKGLEAWETEEHYEMDEVMERITCGGFYKVAKVSGVLPREAEANG